MSWWLSVNKSKNSERKLFKYLIFSGIYKKCAVNYCFTLRSARDRNLYIVLEEKNEVQSLNHSFAELDLFPEAPTDAVWKFVSNLKHRPYETTMETFSKLTDVFCKYINN